MAPQNDSSRLRLALPKGRMQDGVFSLLADASISLRAGERSYRPVISLQAFDVKILKPQNIVEMLDAGARDIGFAGADWVAELQADLVEVLDTGLDPVSLVAAAPSEFLVDGALPTGSPLVVASEYERLTRAWVSKQKIEAHFVRSYGATEVFPPEDADLIVDNTATGSTLEANNLRIIDELMTSSTRLYANPRALEHPDRRVLIDDIVLLVRSVLEARLRVMVEVNVAPDRLEALLAVLPCMRQPTVSQLAGGEGFAVKAAVPRKDVPAVIPRLKAAGGEDIVVTRLAQIIP